MRRLSPLVLLLSIAGCSGDPANSRLGLGDEAIVRAPTPDPKRPPQPTMSDGRGGETTEAELYPDSVRMKPQGTTTTMIQAGSKARIIADDQPADIRGADRPYLADLDGRVDRRWVKVNVLDGRNANEVGELPRNALRPVH